MEELVCAKCAGSLREYRVGDFSLDRCRQCRGLFFDPGDLARVLTEEADPASGGSAGTSSCPRCQIPMDVILAGGEGWFAYELCPACRALWLDSGQLARLEEASLGTQIEAGKDPESRRRRAATVVEKLEMILGQLDRQRADRLARLDRLTQSGLCDRAEARSIRSAIDAESRIALEALGGSRLFEETRQLCIAGFIGGAQFESLRQRVAAS